MSWQDQLRVKPPHSLTIPMAPQWKRHPQNPLYVWNVVTREVVREDELQNRLKAIAIKAITEASDEQAAPTGAQKA